MNTQCLLDIVLVDLQEVEVLDQIIYTNFKNGQPFLPVERT